MDPTEDFAPVPRPCSLCGTRHSRRLRSLCSIFGYFSIRHAIITSESLDLWGPKYPPNTCTQSTEWSYSHQIIARNLLFKNNCTLSKDGFNWWVVGMAKYVRASPLFTWHVSILMIGRRWSESTFHLYITALSVYRINSTALYRYLYLYFISYIIYELNSHIDNLFEYSHKITARIWMRRSFLVMSVLFVLKHF